MTTAREFWNAGADAANQIRHICEENAEFSHQRNATAIKQDILKLFTDRIMQIEDREPEDRGHEILTEAVIHPHAIIESCEGFMKNNNEIKAPKAINYVTRQLVTLASDIEGSINEE